MNLLQLITSGKKKKKDENVTYHIITDTNRVRIKVNSTCKQFEEEIDYCGSTINKNLSSLLSTKTFGILLFWGFVNNHLHSDAIADC